MSDLYFGTLNEDIPQWARKYYTSGNNVDMETTATPESCKTQYADPNDAWSTKNCEVIADANPALKLRSTFCKMLTDEGNGGRKPYCSIWQDQKGLVTFPEYGPDYLHCIKEDGYIDTTIPECALACQENPKQLGCTTPTKPFVDKVKVRQQCIDLNFWQPGDPGCENVARSEPELKLRHNICAFMIKSDIDNNFYPTFDPPTEAYTWCEVNDTNGVVFPEYQHCIKPDGFIDDTQADCAQVCTGNPNHKLCAKVPPPATMAVLGETTAATSADSVTVAFTDPWTKQLATAAFKQTGFALKPKDAITLTMKKTTPRQVTKVTKAAPVATTTTAGKVTKVTSTSSVTVSYTDPWTKKVATSMFTKAGHGLKLNDAVTLTISNATPRKITNVVKKTVPIVNPTIPGKITKVASTSSVTVSYTDPLTKKVTTSVFTKAGHGLKLNDAVTLTIKTTIISIAKI